MLAALLMLCASPKAETDAAAAALAGHNAEMRQLTHPDPLRRPLFFDPVTIESTTPGVPCDHLARRRPDAIAGTGWVVLMEGAAPERMTIRFWLPPPVDEDRAPLGDAADFARKSGFRGEISVVAARKFAWCR